MEKQSKKRPPREGFRRRKNSYYAGMTKKQIAADTAKTAAKWVVISAFLFAYWLVMLLLVSMILVNVWKVTITELIIFACILGSVSSLVYAYMLVHRKFYY
ncbi:MAG: hypothetical protein IJ784_04020 [Ruminiclostridium sp.]|nr:hypothetical protein [Ruminiclostridium sp.]